MKIDKILWPTDMSDNAKKALPFVSSLSQKYGAEVHVLYIAPDLGAFGSWYGDFDRSELEKIQRLDQERAQKELARICEEHLEGCPLYIRHTAIGNPYKEIQKLIEKEKPDLVVLAKAAGGGHFDYGSIADKMARQSPIPILIIPVAS